MPYLTEEGMVSKVDTTGVKASVYAVYDEVSEARQMGEEARAASASMVALVASFGVTGAWR